MKTPVTEISVSTPEEIRTTLVYGDTEVPYTRGKKAASRDGVPLSEIRKYVYSSSWYTPPTKEDLSGLVLVPCKDFSVGDDVVFAEKKGKIIFVSPEWVSIRFRDGSQTDPTLSWNTLHRIIPTA